MYEPAPFRVADEVELIAFLRAHPLGLVILAGSEGPSADLIPFVIDGRHRLRAHFARHNPLRETFSTPQDVLAVFLGPEAYVSPSWYPSKAEHGRVVPTWNYAMVQVRGRAVLREEPEWIAAQIADLTSAQEAHRPHPWAATDAPPTFIEAQIRAIVGLEFEIAEIRGKYKLSQNRSAADRDGVVAGLSAEDILTAQATAAFMKRREGLE